jgi:hypothetical protein
MTAKGSATTSGSSYRSAGWAAIASGAIGIMAFGFLIAFLVRRLFLGGTEEVCVPLLRVHDSGVILQSLLMIPVVLTLASIARQRSPSPTRATVPVGVSALLLVVLFLLLIFVKIVPDDLYMIPQGLLALWLIVENRRLSGVLPRGLARLGIVAGVGLLLVAIFPIGFTLFVDPTHLNGWTPFDYQPPPGTDTANATVHILLLIGTFMGVATYPIWTLLLGRRLLRESGA